MPPAAEGGEVRETLRGLLLDIGGVVHNTAMHLVERLAGTEPAMLPVLEAIGGPAIDTARTLLRLPPRPPGDDY